MDFHDSLILQNAKRDVLLAVGNSAEHGGGGPKHVRRSSLAAKSGRPEDVAVTTEGVRATLEDLGWAKALRLAVYARQRVEDEARADADDDDEDLELYDEFIEEGRKMLAVSATRLVAGATADEVSEDVWTEVADLLTKGEAESGILVGLPGFAGSAAAFVDSELLAPLRWMGFQVEAEAFTAADGAPFPVVRLLLCPAASAAPSEDDEEWRERMNKLIDDI
mmetsp:Transcript_30806/g.106508  ORF Transcript_30806/g.106508 Transcript_30806/m.106508 type:complete len:222 (-) Transcript_30806:111-776(-)